MKLLLLLLPLFVCASFSLENDENDLNEDAPLNLLDINAREGVSERVFQGDIMLTGEQWAQLKQHGMADYDDSKKKRQMNLHFTKWTNNTVYYFFDKSINQGTRQRVAAVHAHMTKKTCLRFVESSTAPNRIRVIHGDGCGSSYIGMATGEQYLSLGIGCEFFGPVAHEFGHALGLEHMHTRADRDEFVTVNRDVVQEKYKEFINKVNLNEQVIVTPYEYGSVMHYSAEAFANHSLGHVTIEAKDGNYKHTMGSPRLSFYDIDMINKYYGCYEKCPAASSAQCKNGGVPNPNNCAICNCPAGYGADLCDQKPSDYGEYLNAAESWKTAMVSTGTYYEPPSDDGFQYNNYWITAPAGKKIQIRIKFMSNNLCYNGCVFGGIEIKTAADIRITSPVLCCMEFINKIFTSEHNPTAIVAYSMQIPSQYQIEYRFVNGSTTTTTPGKSTTTSATTSPSSPSTTPSTTSTSTSSPSRNCTDYHTHEYCVAFKVCSSDNFQKKKMFCAKSCGLCGQAADPCVDLHSQEYCNYMKANPSAYVHLADQSKEYRCAKTLGYCENPL